jgi:hypothetical protein
MMIICVLFLSLKELDMYKKSCIILCLGVSNVLLATENFGCALQTHCDPNVSRESHVTGCSKFVLYGDIDSISSVSYSEEDAGVSPSEEVVDLEVKENISIGEMLNEERFNYCIGMVNAFNHQVPARYIEEAKELLLLLGHDQQTIFDYHMFKHEIHTEFNASLESKRIDSLIDYAFQSGMSEVEIIEKFYRASFPHSNESLKIGRRFAKLMFHSNQYNNLYKLDCFMKLLSNPYGIKCVRRNDIISFMINILEQKDRAITAEKRFEACLMIAKSEGRDIRDRKWHGDKARDLAIFLKDEGKIESAKRMNDRIQNAIKYLKLWGHLNDETLVELSMKPQFGLIDVNLEQLLLDSKSEDASSRAKSLADKLKNRIFDNIGQGLANAYRRNIHFTEEFKVQMQEHMFVYIKNYFLNKHGEHIDQSFQLTGSIYTDDVIENYLIEKTSEYLLQCIRFN